MKKIKKFLKLKDNFFKEKIYFLLIYMKVLIIAEVGINHNGSINQLKNINAHLWKGYVGFKYDRKCC